VDDEPKEQPRWKHDDVQDTEEISDTIDHVITKSAAWRVIAWGTRFIGPQNGQVSAARRGDMIAQDTWRDGSKPMLDSRSRVPRLHTFSS
jgi:hypothetical protein